MTELDRCIAITEAESITSTGLDKDKMLIEVEILDESFYRVNDVNNDKYLYIWRGVEGYEWLKNDDNLVTNMSFNTAQKWCRNFIKNRNYDSKTLLILKYTKKYFIYNEQKVHLKEITGPEVVKYYEPLDLE